MTRSDFKSIVLLTSISCHNLFFALFWSYFLKIMMTLTCFSFYMSFVILTRFITISIHSCICLLNQNAISKFLYGCPVSKICSCAHRNLSKKKSYAELLQNFTKNGMIFIKIYQLELTIRYLNFNCSQAFSNTWKILWLKNKYEKNNISCNICFKLLSRKGFER